MNPDPEHDPRLAAVYRASSDSVQPPARLDDAVRAAARRAVHAGPRRGADRLRRWSVPVSLAAVIVLSVTIVTMMREEGADRWYEDGASVQPLPSQPEAKTETPKPMVQAAPAEPVTKTAPPPVAQAPAAPARTQVKQKTLADAAVMEERDRTEPAAAPASSLAGIAPQAAETMDTVGGAREERATSSMAAPQPRRRAAPAAAMAEKRQDSALMARQSAAVQGAPAKPADPLWRDLEREPQEKWLDRLRELRRDSREEDFARLLAEYRRRFPDRVLPEDLR